MSLLLLFNQPEPAPIIVTGTVRSRASLTGDVRSSDSAAFMGTASVTKLREDGRALATADDYQLVSVPIVVGGTVFSVLVAAVDVKTGALWGVAAIVLTALAMRERAFAVTVAWLANKLTPPNE